MDIRILAFWAPVVCLIAFLVLIAVTYAFRSRGESKHKQGTEQEKVFLSGEDMPDAGMRHVRAHNIYWGFFESLKQYYDPLIRAHTGIVNDYLMWLIGVVAIAGIVILTAGPW
ncbi:MAG TPA: hydrogenase [Dehalococcoidia bacterium]|nr:hydrogenase [Dehalococcoidia bacterium]